MPQSIRSKSSIFLQSAVIPIILVNVVVFILQVVLKDSFTESFILVSADVWSRPWILLTSMFLHGSVTHLLFNMYALFIFGLLLEQRIGRNRFLFIYFASGILAAVASTFFYDRALGASGAIMGMLGVTIMLMPDLKVLFFFIIPMSLRTAGIIFALIDLLGVFGIGIHGIANIAHLVGLGCGLAYGYYLLKQKGKFHKRFTVEPKKKKQPQRQDTVIELTKDDVDDYLKYGRL